MTIRTFAQHFGRHGWVRGGQQGSATGPDLTHKTDESDCVMIARLAIELHCYIPEELDEAWAQLRHLGRRRAQLITSATASVQRVRDFLSVAGR